MRCYGTLLFESIHNRDKYPRLLEDVIGTIDKSLQEKIDLLTRAEETLENIRPTRISRFMRHKLLPIEKELDIQIADQV